MQEQGYIRPKMHRYLLYFSEIRARYLMPMEPGSLVLIMPRVELFDAGFGSPVDTMVVVVVVVAGCT